MGAVDLAPFGGQPQCLGADLKMCRGLGQVEPFGLLVLGRTVNRNLVMRSERSHALPRPTIAMACGELVAVENAGNQIVISNPDQKPNRRDDVMRGAVALPAPAPRQA